MKSNTHSFSLLFMKYNGLMLFFIMLFFSCSKCSNTSTGGGSSGKTDSILPPNIVNINSTTLAPCTLDSDLDWEYVVTEKMGVSGMNPDSFIDYTSLRKFIFFDNWAPFIGYKTCFCGDFEEYEGYVFGFEKDWNFLIKPTDLYNKLMLDSAQIYRPVKRKSNGDIKHWYKNASNTGYLIEGELTPKLEKAMTWFALPSKKNQPTPDVRHKICVYGPWVSEKLHNYRPEIHPAELIWFQDSINFNIHYLIVAQDASNRFANPDRYKGNKAYPWKPWTQKPINGVFKIPFRVNIDNASHDTLFYNLDINTTSNTTAPPLAYSSAKNSIKQALKNAQI